MTGAAIMQPMLITQPMLEQCEKYQDSGNLWNTWLSIFLVIGIFGSYIPQHINIVQRRTIEGLSPYFLLLMNIGSAFAFSNITIVSAPIFHCCSTDLSCLQCVNSLLGFYQILASFLGPLVIVVLSVLFADGSRLERKEIRRMASTILVVDVACVVLVVAAWTLAHSYMYRIAYFLGIASAAVGVVQYLPQLAETYHLKHTGSLSLLTLVIQIPGGYMWCLSLAARDDTNWSVWLPFFVAATLQTVLLGMALYFSIYQTQQVVDQISKPPSLRADSPADYGSIREPPLAQPVEPDIETEGVDA